MSDYCERCDYDTHICPGCGTYLEHGRYVCQECMDEIDRGER